MSIPGLICKNFLILFYYRDFYEKYREIFLLASQRIVKMKTKLNLKMMRESTWVSSTIAFNFQLSVTIVLSLLDEFFFFNVTEYISTM